MQGHNHCLKSTSYPKPEIFLLCFAFFSLCLGFAGMSPALNSLSPCCSLYLPFTQLPVLQLFKRINKAKKRKYLCLQIFPHNLLEIPLKFQKKVSMLETHRKTEELQ